MSRTSPSPGFGPDLRGQTLAGRYALERCLGSGGAATVYAALDRHLRRRVAVKVIHPEHARTDEQRRRVRQEALVGARINHSNVASILDLGDHAGDHGEALLFIVMPLLEGRTLRVAILDGPVAWSTAARWMHQLLAGLAAIHAGGVIHRDIKPENCMLVREDDRERLVVLDLGLAKVTRAGLFSRLPRSATGRIVGTLPYLSPEQILGEPIDERADVYAAGVVFFELLTRRAPFVGSEYEILVGHVERPPPSPGEVAALAGIPEAIERVVLTALAKRREHRYPSALEMDAALVKAIEGEGVDVEATAVASGCGEAQACLAAWKSFDHPRARDLAELAAGLNRAWSPLRVLMSLVAEE